MGWPGKGCSIDLGLPVDTLERTLHYPIRVPAPVAGPGLAASEPAEAEPQAAQDSLPLPQTTVQHASQCLPLDKPKPEVIRSSEADVG